MDFAIPAVATTAADLRKSRFVSIYSSLLTQPWQSAGSATLGYAGFWRVATQIRRLCRANHSDDGRLADVRSVVKSAQFTCPLLCGHKVVTVTQCDIGHNNAGMATH